MSEKSKSQKPHNPSKDTANPSADKTAKTGDDAVTAKDDKSAASAADDKGVPESGGSVASAAAKPAGPAADATTTGAKADTSAGGAKTDKPGVEPEKKASNNSKSTASEKSSADSRKDKNLPAAGAATSSRTGSAGTGSTGSGTGGGKGSNNGGGKAGRFFLWLLFLLLVVGAIAAGGYYLQQQIQTELQARDEQATQQVEQLQQQLRATEQRLQRLTQQQEQLQTGQEQQSELVNQAQQQAQQISSRVSERLSAMQQTLEHQSETLRSLSTTSREDWLLAEAEYLLKLANQRMVIERSTEAAAALLQEADKILRGLNDPQLMPLRRAVARDLTKLTLAAQVDLEGIYLRLASLAENVHQLPTMPQREPPHQRDGSSAPDVNQASASDNAPWWRRAWSKVRDMFGGLGNYVRVRDHAERPQAILPPDAGEYLEQNLRLMLERAQLAAMRQESELYQKTLENVADWAERFYPESQQLNRFTEQVRELAQIEVEQELPDISESLQMLGDYVDRLHQLGEQAAEEAQP